MVLLTCYLVIPIDGELMAVVVNETSAYLQRFIKEYLVVVDGSVYLWLPALGLALGASLRNTLHRVLLTVFILPK